MFGFSRRREPSAVPSPDAPRALELYKYDACFYCRRVMSALEKLGDLGVVLRDTRKEPEARAFLIEKTGRTQVPCLFIDGEPLLESLDIIDWLERYEAARFDETTAQKMAQELFQEWIEEEVLCKIRRLT